MARYRRQEEQEDNRYALVYKLPDKNYKYTPEELDELASLYITRRWLVDLKPRPNHSDQGTTNTVLFACCFIPMWIFCHLTLWYATGGDNLAASTWDHTIELIQPKVGFGGLIMSSLILTILVLLGIGGIISRFSYAQQDEEDRNTEKLLAKELNAHSQVVEEMGRQMLTLKQNNENGMKELEKAYYDVAKYKKMYQEMKSKSEKLDKQVQKLEIKTLKQDTVIAKLHNTIARSKNIEDTVDNSGLGMYAE